MAKFDSKSFNPQAFGAYVNRIPNVAKNELAKSGAVGSNEQARAALGNQTGSLYARIPYFGRIDGSTSQNNDGATDIASTNTTTYEQGFIVASRMDSWTERSFSKNITAGVDFMDNVAAQIADYKFDVRQAMLLAILEGVYGMSVEGDTVAATAAKEFIEKHTFDISGEADDAAMVGSTTLNKAIQKACGDNKNIFKLVIMHSEVATNLENIKLLKYMTQTDADGIERELVSAITTFAQKANDWFNKNFNAGYRYASNNTYIRVNTNTLRSYADRLYKVNQRIIKLDRRLDQLYTKVGLFDLWNLLQADLRTGYSWRLNRCTNYLNDTAYEFEEAERSISSQI